jgi:hypothetical protein
MGRQVLVKRLETNQGAQAIRVVHLCHLFRLHHPCRPCHQYQVDLMRRKNVRSYTNKVILKTHLEVQPLPVGHLVHPVHLFHLFQEVLYIKKKD